MEEKSIFIWFLRWRKYSFLLMAVFKTAILVIISFLAPLKMYKLESLYQ